MTLVAFQENNSLTMILTMTRTIILSLMALATASSAWAECKVGEAGERFVVTDGVILDPKTGLEWQMCLHGQTQAVSYTHLTLPTIYSV